MADIGIIKFRLGEMNFCMYSDRIVEIVRFTGVRQIPRPLPYVVGIIQLRKRVVAVVDLRKRLGLPPITLSKDTALIVVNLSVGMFGLLVDAIADFKRIAEALILPPISLAGFPEHLLHGVLTEKDDILLLPHFDKIFASYINIAVVPISASEKIAFQYRFTPGALSRTLENILLHQPCLDPEIARELPHALFLPSCRVHKMTSYYPDFQPRQALVKKPEPRRGTSQKLRSGDEQYASLSQRLQQRLRGETSIKGEGEADLLDGLLADPQASISKRLEDILHKGAGPAATGRKLAQALQLAPTALTKYLTYYASPLLGGAGVGLPLSIINCQSIPLLGGVGVGLPRSREAGGELSIVNYQLSIVNCQLIPLLGGGGVRNMSNLLRGSTQSSRRRPTPSRGDAPGRLRPKGVLAPPPAGGFYSPNRRPKRHAYWLIRSGSCS